MNHETREMSTESHGKEQGLERLCCEYPTIEARIISSAEKGVSRRRSRRAAPVSYTHLRAHETSLHLVCRLLLEKKNAGLARQNNSIKYNYVPVHL